MTARTRESFSTNESEINVTTPGWLLTDYRRATALLHQQWQASLVRVNDRLHALLPQSPGETSMSLNSPSAMTLSRSGMASMNTTGQDIPLTRTRTKDEVRLILTGAYAHVVAPPSALIPVNSGTLRPTDERRAGPPQPPSPEQTPTTAAVQPSNPPSYEGSSAGRPEALTNTSPPSPATSPPLSPPRSPPLPAPLHSISNTHHKHHRHPPMAGTTAALDAGPHHRLVVTAPDGNPASHKKLSKDEVKARLTRCYARTPCAARA